MPEFWIVIAGVVGLAVGGAVGYLLCDRKAQREAAEAGRRGAELEARLATTLDEYKQRGLEIQRARVTLDERQERASKAESLASAAAARVDGLRGEVAERDARLRDLSSQLATARDDVAALKVDAQKLASELDGERANVAEQKRLLGEAETKFKDVFAGVGGEALDKNSKAFLELAGQRFDVLTEKADGDLGRRQEQIEKLVAPMTVLLKKYEERLKEVEDKRVNDKEQLSNVLAALQQSHARLDTQTGQLATAMSKGNTRGRWGEIALERIVELAGMTKNVDFETQKTVDGEAGGGGRQAAAGHDGAAARRPADRLGREGAVGPLLRRLRREGRGPPGGVVPRVRQKRPRPRDGIVGPRVPGPGEGDAGVRGDVPARRGVPVRGGGTRPENH